ncbi:geranyl transferase [Marinomonas agarivorans]|nr:geranyl transferase [Marinomonas agarivorans]
MNLHIFSKHTLTRVDEYLSTKLSSYAPATDLQTAMSYSLFNGGKRIRPMLVYASAELIGEISVLSDASAAAIESIHAYSLIHDDLPAMDDDDLRRGKPTCHIQFDEATAILAGDALQTFAFELLSEVNLGESSQQLTLMRELIQASGRHGMITGQMIDLAAQNQSLSLADLEQMHAHKTGALIRASVRMGALSAVTPPEKALTEKQLECLTSYANAIGLAFQVQDDIIDLTSDTATLGKTQFADANANKPTYPQLLGLDGAQSLVLKLHQQAMDEITLFGDKAQTLTAIANYIINRNH